MTAGSGEGAGPPTINLICVKVAWRGRTVASLEAPFHVIEVNPEPEHPKGRKGLVLANAWRQMATDVDVGMLLLDGDVVIEPTDFLTMVNHVARDVGAVWTAPARLWPRATQLPSWVWGHRREPVPGATREETLQQWQVDVNDPDWFTFCFTFLPRRLVEAAIENGLREWHYPYVDLNMHQLARREGVPVRVVRGDCHPKHVNF